MKQLMLGNAAVARGLYEAGCCVISSYPGTPSTEITEEAAKFDDIYCEWAPNEKVAMEVAFGASLAGKRSFCAMKHVGLNVAADPLFTVAYTGVNAGMVIAVADDPGMFSSQNEQDSRHYAIGEEASVLKLVMVHPMPEGLIRDFAAKVDRLVVVEELDPIIENYCRQLGLTVSGKEALPLEGEFSQNLVAAKLGGAVHTGTALEDAIPPRPPVMCAGCPHRGLFYTLAKNKCTVLGDIGCYTLGAVAPLNAMEMTLCMGASISGIHGFNKALGEKSEGKTVAVIGDSTFMHSGMTGLANIAYNQSNSTVIILDNSITGMTGHQQNPTTGYNIKGEPAGKIDLEQLCRAMGFERVRVVDPYDLKATDQAVKEELAAREPSVIISRRPCALLKYVKHQAPLAVDTDKCVGCKSCMRIGCPAISMKEGKAHVDNTLCVGCGVCEQMCAFGAFQSTEKEG